MPTAAQVFGADATQAAVFEAVRPTVAQLIDGYSATAYVADRARRGEMSRSEAADAFRLARHGGMDEAAFAAAIGKSLTPWVGRPEQDIADLWLRLFRQRYGTRLFPGAWALVKAHQRKGHTVAIATSAMAAQVAPVAAELGIDVVLCTHVTTRDGKLTGGVGRPTLWGSGKADAVRAHARAHGIDLSHAHAYANGDEDIDFLHLAGHPAAVNPDAGWPWWRPGRIGRCSASRVASPRRWRGRAPPPPTARWRWRRWAASPMPP